MLRYSSHLIPTWLQNAIKGLRSKQVHKKTTLMSGFLLSIIFNTFFITM
jgi:hypothetical protein